MNEYEGNEERGLEDFREDLRDLVGGERDFFGEEWRGGGFEEGISGDGSCKD